MASEKADVLKRLEEEGLAQLPAIFDALMEVARGARIYVRLEDPKPKGAVLEGKGRIIGERHDKEHTGARGTEKAEKKVCPTCNRSLQRTDLGEPVEVWRTLPDTSLLRYLHEHLAGKAKAKEDRNIDPVINIIFPAIDTKWNPETQAEKAEQERAQAPEPPSVGI